MSKKSARIDIHTHIIQRDFPDFTRLYGGGRWPYLEAIDDETANIMVNGNIFRKINREAWDPERRIQRMIREGVDMEVLSPIPITLCYWASNEGAAKLARIQNEYLADVVKKYPTRFAALGTVPLQDVELAILEMDYSVNKLGLNGIMIGSNVNGLNLDDPNYQPFFEMAEQWNVPLFIHPYDMVGKERHAKYGMTYTVGMPIELALSVGSLLLGGILEKFPDLKICLAHGGGALPFILPRMDKGWETWPNVQKIPHPPSYYAKKLYYDALVYEPENIKYLIRLAGHERLMMGTDYPFPVQETPPGKSILETNGLTSDEIDAMLGRNAQAFLQV